MKKYLLVSLCAFLFTASISYGQIVFAEDFNYTAGTLLSANGWTAVSSAGTNPITVSTPGLSLTNYYANSGGAVSLSGSGEDDNKTFTAQTSGSLYLSFLLKVTAATTGDYFIALSPATQTNYTARTFVKSNGSGGFNIGVSKSNEAATYGTTAYATGTTYLVVVKFTFNTTSTTDDAISVYVFPSVTANMTEPATSEIGPYVCPDAAKTDPVTLESITIRQGGASSAPSLTVDGIRLSTSWTGGVIVGIEKEEGVIPNNYSLSQNYPNPFNPTTKISFSVTTPGNYTLKVFNMLGEEVATLLNNQLSAGKYSFDFNAKNLSSGTYVYRLTGNNVNISQKMLLLK